MPISEPRSMHSAAHIDGDVCRSCTLGPYTIGQLSDSISANGVPAGEALREGMLWSFSTYFAAFVRWHYHSEPLAQTNTRA